VIFAADLPGGGQRAGAGPAGHMDRGRLRGIVVLAVIVADLAILEYLGLRRLGTEN